MQTRSYPYFDDDELPLLPLRARLAAAEEKERKRARTSVGKPDGILGTSSPSSVPPPPPAGARSESAVTVEDTDALDCGVCYLPLKPPIFQCAVGHVVCSLCRDKLKDNRKCHVCRGATGGFRRCHAMERLVDSSRVACQNAAYGCTARPPYHDQKGHQELCLHAPCQCPGEACSFIGSVEALLDHFAGVHGWPCSTKIRINKISYIHLKDGFNFIRLDDDQGATTRADRQCLFLLDVKRQALSRAISVLLIHPHASVDDQQPCMKHMNCELTYSQSTLSIICPPKDLVMSHDQKSKFIVTCTDLSKGLPNPDERFQFVVPNFVLPGDKKDAVNVGLRIQSI
ncbi:unnamed protein product [Urochloa decumbens]|uniref:RING-type E3 ubiquitin transferase n=1 Tax=Urochloa decumbens TaxID=240449 RepID=A0ABC9GMA9_9POAL